MSGWATGTVSDATCTDEDMFVSGGGSAADVDTSGHNVTDGHLGVQMFNAAALVRDIHMLCVRACDYVTCTAHTVYRVGCHGVILGCTARFEGPNLENYCKV